MNTSAQEKEWMIYGVNGYTGRHCAEEALNRGLRPVLAGRNEKTVAAVAKELHLPYKIFDLESSEVVAAALSGMSVVLNCAGPFSATAEVFLAACTKTGCHYLDVTGEISVFEYVHKLNKRWEKAGVMALPGVGFDVVPTDCMAATLKEALPDATHLTMAFKAGVSKVSPGTAKTILEGFSAGGAVRRDGNLVKIPIASLSRTIPYESGASPSIAIPWGDVSTAFYSTGIPNIEFFTAVPFSQLFQMKLMRYFAPFIRFSPIQSVIKAVIGKVIQGPEVADRKDDCSELYGEVINAAGVKKAVVMSTPNGYDLTFDAAVSAVERTLDREDLKGAHTPSSAFGKDFVNSLQGVTLRFVDTA